MRRSHEDWVHLTLKPKYYSAVDEIRTPHVGPWKSPGGGRPAAAVGPQDRNGHSQWERSREERDATVRHPLGALPGSVWSVPTEPLKVPKWLTTADMQADIDAPDHFAAFCQEWPRRLILGWSPPGVCVECGEGRRPVVDKCHTHLATRSDESMAHRALEPLARTRMHDQTTSVTATITGYACACPTPDAPTTPSVILDPFSGTGTTIAVAKALGRIGIGVDLSHDYNRLAQWRVNDPALRAKVQGRAWQERQGVLL